VISVATGVFVLLLSGVLQTPAAVVELAGGSAKGTTEVAAVSTPEARPDFAARQGDAELSQRLLMRLLKRGYLTRSCLAIAANDSAVRLEGTVRRKSDRAAIERLVTAEPGVARVTNNLQTGSCPSPSRNPK
jgi:osmotically-inducible protein OsmY